MLKRQFAIYIFCLLHFNLFAQIKNKTFEIESVKTDKNYFNFIIKNDILYLGTSEGLVEIGQNHKEILVDHSLKNYIKLSNNIIIGNQLSSEKENKDDNNYNYLLPKKYVAVQSKSIIYKNKLYIINTGILFIYNISQFSISYDSLSVRSISKNIVGTYGGIFINGQKLAYPSYTDGKVREFNNEQFICYGGLLHIKNKISTDYHSNSSGEILIGDKEIGSARDIIKIKENQYCVATNRGVFDINLKEKTADTVYFDKTINERINFFFLDSTKNIISRIFYTINDKIYFYSTLDKRSTLYFDSKTKEVIQDIYAHTLSEMYLLFADRLLKYSYDIYENKYNVETIVPNLNLAHNIAFYKEKLCISTNEGTHFYDLKNNKFYSKIIPLENNRRSMTVVDDTLKIGTISGVVSISNENLNSSIKIKEEEEKNISKNSTLNNKDIIIYFLITVLLIISGLFWYLIRRKKSTKTIDEIQIESIVSKENIILHIQQNITTVTILSICDHFKINRIRLYEILENETPGEVIRNFRMHLVRKFRRAKMTEEEIAKQTGFSVSYLKKIY